MTMTKPQKIPEPRPVRYRCPDHGVFTVLRVYGGGMGQACQSARCTECDSKCSRVRRYNMMHVSVSSAVYDRIIAAALSWNWPLTKVVEEAVRDV